MQNRFLSSVAGAQAALAAILIAVVIAGCGPISTLEAWSKTERSKPSPDTVLVQDAPKVLNRNESKYAALVNEFAVMALFSKVVYRDDLDQKTRIGTACAVAPGAKATRFGMPSARWMRLQLPDDVSGKDMRTCFDGDGLFYETYAHYEQNDAKPDTVVIAIRGTENYTRMEKIQDWESNFGAALGTDPKEYRLAREHILPLIEHLVTLNKKIKIFVTGHSLGGGIAQQMAYASNDVAAAYVFDTSPVTNWSQMKNMKDSPIRNETPVIKRINHFNEALALPRLLATRLTTIRVNRSDYDFAFQSLKKVDAHEMGILACHLAVRLPSTGGEHDFPVEYVETMVRDGSICPGGEGKVELPREYCAKLAKPPASCQRSGKIITAGV